MSAVDKKDEKLNIETIKWGKITWINVEKPTSSDMGYLAKNYLFNLFDLEDCLSRIERPKIDEYENYLFLVLHFPVFKQESRVTTSSQVSIFIGENPNAIDHRKPAATVTGKPDVSMSAERTGAGRTHGAQLGLPPVPYPRPTGGLLFSYP